MRKVVIVPNPKKDTGLAVTDVVAKKLCSLGFSTYIFEEYHDANEPREFSDCLSGAELVIVIGGDGSVIDASRLAVDMDVPLLGVNLGKVGYLSEVEPDNIDILDRLLTGEYAVSEKMLLSAEKYSRDGIVNLSPRYALNDVIISHGDYCGISEFKLENSSGERITYMADGIIAATPSGSTAYSMSAGGPIISHKLDSVMITPICPHSFFNRSMVYDSDEVIRISNCNQEPLNISVDGRYFSSLDLGESCIVKKAPKRLKMLTFSENYSLSALFKKIKVFGNSI